MFRPPSHRWPWRTAAILLVLLTLWPLSHYYQPRLMLWYNTARLTLALTPNSLDILVRPPNFERPIPAPRFRIAPIADSEAFLQSHLTPQASPADPFPILYDLSDFYPPTTRPPDLDSRDLEPRPELDFLKEPALASHGSIELHRPYLFASFDAQGHRLLIQHLNQIRSNK